METLGLESTQISILKYLEKDIREKLGKPEKGQEACRKDQESLV